MDKKLAITFLLFLASIVEAHCGSISVTKFGAKPGGKSDIVQALTKAWNEACASTTPSEIVVPKGLYFLSQVKFQGPCKAPITFNLQGNLQAHIDPSNTKVGEWITFQYVDFLTITGGGTFDGQGTRAWNQNNCHKTFSCTKFPYYCNVYYLDYSPVPMLTSDNISSITVLRLIQCGADGTPVNTRTKILGLRAEIALNSSNLSFNFIKHSTVGSVTTMDSKNFHVNLLGCQNFTFKRFNVRAPGDSKNTDGIHVGKSKQINILDSNIQTGDDCISVGDGVEQLKIRNVECGPGHGISVGSLGKYQNEEPVNGIYIENCTLKGTTNGIRVKTWPDSFQTVVTDMHVKDIHFENVQFPIIVDQEYCPWNQCSMKSPSKVKISKLSFTNLWGTSATKEVVKLVCSKGVPCENVELTNIDLKFTGNQPGGVSSICSNVKPILKGTQNPKLCTS